MSTSLINYERRYKIQSTKRKGVSSQNVKQKGSVLVRMSKEEPQSQVEIADNNV